jgi:ABC-type transporter Mla MlaB component
VERFAEAHATYWTLDDAIVLVLVGVLDHRIEDCVGTLTRRARRAQLPLAIDLSEVTHISVDVLALLLDAHAGPGVTFIPPLPATFLTLTAMTGTSTTFAVQAAEPHHGRR